MSEEKIPMTPSSLWHQNGTPDPHGSTYDCERARLTLGELTDDVLANAAYLGYDQRPHPGDIIAGKAFSPIALMSGVKDRIRWLSRALIKEQQKVTNLRNGLDILTQVIYDRAKEQGIAGSPPQDLIQTIHLVNLMIPPNITDKQKDEQG